MNRNMSNLNIGGSKKVQSIETLLCRKAIFTRINMIVSNKTTIQICGRIKIFGPEVVLRNNCNLLMLSRIHRYR